MEASSESFARIDMIAKNTFSMCKKILDISILSSKIRYKNKSQLSPCSLVRLYIYKWYISCDIDMRPVYIYKKYNLFNMKG